VPVDAWRKGHLGGALPLPLALGCLLSLSLYTPCGPLGSSRGRNLGESVGVWDTGALLDRDQGGECQQNKRIGLPFAGLNLRHRAVAHEAAGTPMLMQRVSDLLN